MAARGFELPKLKMPKRRGKITTYPDLETQRLYELGQDNGWDTPAIVRDAVKEALLKCKDALVKKASES